MAHIIVDFLSATLERSVEFAVILPSITAPELGIYKSGEAHYEGQAKYPVVYLLHGYLNDYHSWEAYTSIERYAEENNIAVVIISGENKSFSNVHNDYFEDFIEGELQDFVKGTFPISDRPEDTYIAGLSMGGFGALYHALKYPEKYQAVGAFSPAIIEKYEGCRKKTVNLTELLKKDIAEGIDLPWMYVTIGNKDDLLPEVKPYLQEMKKSHVEGYQKIVPGYAHEWPFWDIEVKYFLEMLPRTDAYAGTKKRI